MANISSVYTGLWMNRQYNSIEGATVTLTSSSASYVVAFLALFLSVVAGHFWAILSFVVFQARSTLESRNGQHHQQQVILRNYHAPGAAIWHILQVMLVWRKAQGFKAVIAVLPIILLALVSLMSFAVAGILSAKVTNKESDVLIKGETCGFWNDPKGRHNFEYRDHIVNLVEDVHLASTISATCSKNSSITRDCVSYAPREIEWSTTTDIACPFEDTMCYQNKTVRFDTGLMDTAIHFGINAIKEDRMQYRFIAECAPLVRERYLNDWHIINQTRYKPGSHKNEVLQEQVTEKWIELFYGVNNEWEMNSTFRYSDTDSIHDMFGGQLWSFSATSKYVSIEGPDIAYIPIPELIRTDADVNLLCLRQKLGLEYSQPVLDPWFEAKVHQTKVFNNGLGEIRNKTFYSPEFPLSTVGCTSQYQWCEPSSGECTKLNGALPTTKDAKNRFNSREKQKATLRRMEQIGFALGDLRSLVKMISGAAPLLNRYSISRTVNLPPDQWIQELHHMFSTSVKLMQIRNYRYTGGYVSTMQVRPNITAPAADEMWFCDSQVVRRADYQSLSVLSIAMICVIGLLIIVVSLSLESVVAWYQKKYNKRITATEEWEMLQIESLQKHLYKSYGADWTEGDVNLDDVMKKVKIKD